MQLKATRASLQPRSKGSDTVTALPWMWRPTRNRVTTCFPHPEFFWSKNPFGQVQHEKAGEKVPAKCRKETMHGLVSLGMLEKPHLIHSNGEGADQESPHTIHS